MFFKTKCSDCGKRNPIAHTEHVTTMTNGDLSFHYCAECHQKREITRAKYVKDYEKHFESERKEQEKQRRYEYLKREIELVELEKKAKELGIQ